MASVGATVASPPPTATVRPALRVWGLGFRVFGVLGFRVSGFRV